MTDSGSSRSPLVLRLGIGGLCSGLPASTMRLEGIRRRLRKDVRVQRKFAVCVFATACAAVSTTAQAGSRVALEGSPLRITPPHLNFGSTQKGAVRSRSITITNTSGATITLNAGWATDAPLDPGFGFPVGDTCLRTESEQVLPGQQCTLTFTFSPLAPGAASAEFVFSFDDWDSASTRVTLDARGAG